MPPAERGAVLPLFLVMITVLLGMAGMAIDYGWYYYNGLTARKAAESAALAGVVHMPQPNCTPPGSGTEPNVVAQEIATLNGYEDGLGDVAVSVAQGGSCAQLTVTVTDTIEPFFMTVFGFDAMQISQSATAEHLPNLKMGSDEAYLGEDPDTPGRDRNFFVAISGEDRRKGNGDAFAAQRRDNGNSNPEYVVPSYYYAFEVPLGSSLVGGNAYVQVYDPQAHDAGGTGNDGPNANTNDWVFRDTSSTNDDGWDTKTRFRVFKPDESPNQWTDNDQLVNSNCQPTFRGRSDAYDRENSNYDPALEDTWVQVCAISAVESGVYVIEVSSDYGSNDGTDTINGFSIRGGTSPTGNPITSSSDLQVYGLGTMSLWQFDTGSNPVFKIARVDEVYAGASLIISLWDVSDIGSNASIEFVGATSGANPIDCDVRVLTDRRTVAQDWHGDSNGGDGTTCKLSFTDREYNNQWLEFRFDIPPAYACPAGSGASPASPGCWMFVSYSVSGTITDRTTWSATIDGQPIHLIP